MPRFAANLTMLWPELEPLERFGAAARAGFAHVEMLFPQRLEADRLERMCREHELRMVLFDPLAGDWDAGERGLLCLPGRERELVDTVRDALALAKRLGTRRLNVLAGIAPDGAPPAALRETAVANLRAAAPLCAAEGVTLLVEAINHVDMPGYFLGTVDEAAALVREVGRPNVRLQLDQYHVAMSGGDALAAFVRHREIVAHVQIADAPGRHQPGTGAQPIAAFLEALDRLGYGGCVGLEYRPLGTTEDSLAWLDRAQARLGPRATRPRSPSPPAAWGAPRST